MKDSRDYELFQAWLIHMDDALDLFMQSLLTPLRAELDGSRASLDKLEAWLLSRYGSVAAIRAPSESSTLDGAARYVGEVFPRTTGSKWDIELEDPKYIYHKLPTLKGGRLQRMPACPLTMVTASMDRRTGKLFSTVVGNFVPPTE